MRKHLVKHGNSLALVIEKPILELLQADADTIFEVTTDGHTLLLTPVSDNHEDDSFDAALTAANDRYQGSLGRLSE